MNRSLYALFSSFLSIKFNIDNAKKKYFQLLMNRFGGIKTGLFPANGIDTLIFSKQEYSTIQQWSPISQIIFVTSNLPILPTQMSNASIYLNGEPINLSSTYGNASNIITSIQTEEMAYKPSLLYLPTAQYRYIDLYNNMPITSVDVQVKWVDKFGFTRDLYLPNNASCSIKMLFQKKDNK